MRSIFTVICGFFFLIGSSNVVFASIPPHPRVQQSIKEKKIPLPYHLANRKEAEQRGINSAGILLKDKKTILQKRLSISTAFKALAIIIKFSDKQSQVASVFFDSLLYANNSNSLRNYYKEVSYGTMDVVTVNFPSSLGWYTAPQTYSYYTNGNAGFGNYPQNAQKLAEDAIAAVNSSVNFSQYDNDADGYVDALFIIHAGQGAEYTGNSNDIWSHQWNTYTPQLVDGVYAYIYSMEPEYWATPGDMTCGVYAHEAGHAVFGLPDLYDYDYDSYGLGQWSLMAGGSWNGILGNSPAHPDAWSRSQMGFVTPTNIVTNTTNVNIPAVKNNATIFRLWTDGLSSTEYYLVENRQKVGYDTYLPASGICIYHVDETQYGNDNQWYPGYTNYGHYMVALEQADGLWDLEKDQNSGNYGDPYPGLTDNRTFNLSSTPNSNDYNFDLTSVAVTNISTSAMTMSADFSVEMIPPEIAVSPDSFYADLFTGQNNTQTLNINNSGPGDLYFNISFQDAASQLMSTLETKKAHINNRNDAWVMQILRANEQVARQTFAKTSPADLMNRSNISTAAKSAEEIWKLRQTDNFANSGTLYAVVLDGYGTFYHNSVIWDELNASWSEYGTDQILIDYSTFHNNTITYDALKASGANVVIISDNWNPDQGYGTFSISECQDIARYVNEGAGLYISSGTFNNADDPRQQDQVSYLAPLVGLSATSSYHWGVDWNQQFYSQNPAHPLLKDISVPYYSGAGYSVVPIGGTWTTNEISTGTVVASSNDGYAIIVAYKNRVYISSMPENIFNANKSDKQFVYNAITLSGISWLTGDPISGTVPPGESRDVSITFDATGMNTGDYHADINVNSNDEDEPTIRVGAQLHVTGAPEISLSDTLFNFDTVFVSGAKQDTLTVINLGTDILSVNSIESDNSAFTIDTTNFSLNPRESQKVIITFTPSSPEYYSGKLTISSNDPDEDTLIVTLEGESILPPDISVLPDSLYADLFTGAVTNKTVTISNTGLSNLKFDIAIEMKKSAQIDKVSVSQRLRSTSLNEMLKAEHKQNEVIVKFKKGLATSQKASIRNDIKATVKKRFKIIGAEVWNLSNISVADAITRYKNHPLVEYIEPNYIVRAIDTTPNDPYYSYLWGMQKIQAPKAWDRTTGNDVLIGVIDTGIDDEHVDLAANLWTNPDEVPNNGIDDDGNGYIDDIHGWDFYNNDNDPYDDNSHGTHVSGTIAAEGNNSIGVAGVCWSARIMALKFLGASGSGSTDDAISALEYATMMQVRLTNNSWGGGDFSQAMHDAIQAAGNAEALFIAAAGNNYGNNNDLYPHYPSSYDLDNIIAVASTTSGDILSDFSNYGPTSVDLAAPGSEIYSTVPGNSYSTKSGTSMATPHVSGVAGLILSLNSTLGWSDVKNIILSSVDTLPVLTGTCVTGGRLNAWKAVQNTQTWLAIEPKSGIVSPGGSMDLTVTFNATGMYGGDYDGDIKILNNDPDENPVRVPAHLQVTGVQDIAVSDTMINFDTVFISTNRQKILKVTNDGTDLLTISNISSDNSDFTTDIINFSLNPREYQNVVVTFTPTSVGHQLGTLTITSNDPDESTVLIDLQGVGILPPDINVSCSTDTLHANLFTDETTQQTCTISNTGASNLNFKVNSEYLTVAAVSVKVHSIERDNQPVDLIKTVNDGTINGESAERSPNQSAVDIQNRINAQWDLKFNYDIQTPSGDIRCVGVEFDGTYFYVSGADSFTVPKIYKFDASGNYIGKFIAPGATAGGWGLRDLAYDGTYLYGSDDQMVTQFDVNGNLITEITGPLSTNRALAYDPKTDHFWTADWATSIYEFDRSGNIINTFTNPGLTSIYGMAWDGYSEGGPFLWIFDQSGYPAQTFYQLNPKTGLLTGLTYAVDLGDPLAIAGGAFLTVSWDPSVVILGGLSQSSPDRIFGYEVGPAYNWLTGSPESGIIPPNSSVELTVTFDAAKMYGGNYYGNLLISSNDPDEDTAKIPAHLKVTGVPDIALSDTALNYGNIFIGASKIDTILVSNDGTDILTVSNITSDNGDYSVSATNFSLNPGEKQNVVVTFTPSVVGAREGMLTITSNDPDEVSVVVRLHGVGLLPPDIAVTPDSLSADLFTGGTTTKTITISNTGASDLNFAIDINMHTMMPTVRKENDILQSHSNTNQDQEPKIVMFEPGKYISLSHDGTSNVKGHVTNAMHELKPFTVTKTSSVGLNVLLAYADTGASYIAGQLISYPDIAVVDGYDTRNSTPSLSQLQNYDVVVAWTNYNPFDATALGNVLADYVDQGGGVILGTFDWSFFGTLTGRIMDSSYTPLVMNGGNYYDSVSMVIVDPNHPIMSGVLSASDIYHSYTALTPGAHLVTQWSNGDNMVAVKGRVVGLNSYIGDYFSWSGDIPLIVHNSIVFVGAGMQWLSAEPTSGMIPVGQSMDINMTFDAKSLNSGEYVANININSNDPDEDTVIVPARLHVTSAPDIALSDTVLDYDTVLTGTTCRETLTVANIGTEVLTVSNITSNNPEFTIDTTNFSISPNGKESVVVKFTPITTGLKNAVLTITSNDPDEPSVNVMLYGFGATPPEISVSPNSFNVNLFSGDTSTKALTISNSGGSNLYYNIKINSSTLTLIDQDNKATLGFYADKNRISLSTHLPHPFTVPDNKKINQLDPGDILGTYYNFPDSNTGMVWVGNFIYVVNWPISKLYKYDVNTQQIVSNSSIHSYAYGIAWDGQYLWIGNDAGNIYGYDLNGTLVGSFSVPFSDYPALTWDGQYFIVSRAFNNYPTFYRINYSGATIDSFSSSYSSIIDQTVWVPSHSDGELWGNDPNGNIIQLKLYNGIASIIQLFPFYDNNSSYSLGHNGTDLWWSDWDGTLYQIDDGIRELNWLSVDPTSGTIPAGQSMDVAIIFNASRIDSGDFNGNLIIYNNDNDEDSISIPAHLTVKYGINDPPITQRKIHDIITSEDAPSHKFVDLDTVFTDPDGDPLTFTVSKEEGGFRVTIDTANIATLALDRDWNGSGYLIFSGCDNKYCAYDTVQITVTPVPDAPSPFHLVSPKNNDTIKFVTPYQPIQFAWNAAEDPDQGDTLDYYLHIEGPGFDTTTATLRDTTISMDIRPLLNGLSEYKWDVWVTDGIDSSSSIDTFSFRTDVKTDVAANEGKKIPTTYALNQNYPNPFNPITKISFDIPEQSTVSIIIYDVIGREVRKLLHENTYEPGYFDVLWDGTNSYNITLPSGLYFVRIHATSIYNSDRSFVTTRKMMLVK